MNTNKYEDSRRKQAFLPSLRLCASAVKKPLVPAFRFPGLQRSMFSVRHSMFSASLSLGIRPSLSAILALSLSALSAHALTASPYNGIMDRNVFGLKAPPPPPDPEANKPPAAPSTITLTGITTILGNKRALLRVAMPARPPEPAKDENFMLTEGQRDGSLEVLEINERDGSVKVNNAGQVTLLTFDKNGAKPVASAAPAGGLPVPRQIPFPALPGAPGSAGNPGGAHPIPTRTIRTGQTQGDNQSQSETAALNPNSLAAQAQFQNSITPEEQTLMIEAQRMHLQQQGNDEGAALFPPTELSSDQAGLAPQ